MPEALNARGEAILRKFSKALAIDFFHTHPRAEALLWVQELQEDKQSQMGGFNIRYEHHLKSKMMGIFSDMMNHEISWCKIRYIF